MAHWPEGPRQSRLSVQSDEPAIGAFDLTMALIAGGRMAVRDLGNMTVVEIEKIYRLCMDPAGSGHLAVSWIWSPSVVEMKARGLKVRQATPAEGYRAGAGRMHAVKKRPRE